MFRLEQPAAAVALRLLATVNPADSTNKLGGRLWALGEQFLDKNLFFLFPGDGVAPAGGEALRWTKGLEALALRRLASPPAVTGEAESVSAAAGMDSTEKAWR